MLSETMQEDFSGQSHPLGEQEMFNRLKQRGVVDNILQQIQFDGGTGHGHRPATHFTDKENILHSVGDKKSKIFLHVLYLHLDFVYAIMLVFIIHGLEITTCTCIYVRES